MSGGVAVKTVCSAPRLELYLSGIWIFDESFIDMLTRSLGQYT